MNTRPARVPNVDTYGYLASRLEWRAIRAEQRAFIESFNRQVTEIEARDNALRGQGQNTPEGKP